MNVQEKLRSLPSVDEALKHPRVLQWLEQHPYPLVKEAIVQSIDASRKSILSGTNAPTDFDDLAPLMERTLTRLTRPGLRPLINATGIVMHTNLGRAPLSEHALQNVLRVARGYSTLEYDVEQGRRGKRYSHIQPVLRRVTGAEDGIAVNNNAGAVLLCLKALAEGREVIVSRGELVEIGGSFRVPEVMTQSGAILREVGATNKTHPRDYEQAINENTALLLKVHQSNFRIQGFTEDVSLRELKAIGERHGIPVMYDMGSGCLVDLHAHGIHSEQTVAEVVATGVDLVTFSGDKLLGGPQAGLIVGTKAIIAAIAQSPLLRALRIDKLTLAALETTLYDYVDLPGAIERIPTLSMLLADEGKIKSRARRLATRIRKSSVQGLTVTVRRDVTYSGGGALAAEEIPTWVVALKSDRLRPAELEQRLRLGGPDTPGVIARIADDNLLLDVRTVFDNEVSLVARAVKYINT